MKKVFLILIISFYTVFSLFSQKVERLGQINDLLMLNGRGGGPGSPNEISVNEVYDQIKIMNKNSKFTYFDINTLKGIAREDYRSSFSLVQKRLKNFDINFSDNSLEILNEGLQKLYLGGSNQISAGISFILKKGNGYIVFYVNEAGVPGAADTDGKIYSNYEAYDFLEQYDKEKYGQSLKRANELGLYNEFLNRNVLIWGETYYSSIKNISCVYGENPYIRTMDLIQYDQMGYGYEFYEYLRDSKICIVSPQGKRFDLLPVVSASNILSEYTWVQDRSLSWYVGFGGNIYYYIAGEEYTEVFRIRRTWGNPDFYAMAVNGYTEDEYGKYVKEVLPKMSKTDLRLLRNTIFALYGVHFKSEDLAKYFDRQVWYTDEGLTSGEVTLPAHRQKLVEMIQKLEK